MSLLAAWFISRAHVFFAEELLGARRVGGGSWPRGGTKR